jgi:hypothetical protein
MIIRKEFDFHTVEAVKSEYSVEFKIYTGIGYIEQYEEDLKMGFDDTGPQYDEDPLMVGYIKWDGCSNWDFPLPQGVTHPLHFCSHLEIKAFGNMLASLYEWAAELMPNHKDMILG